MEAPTEASTRPPHRRARGVLLTLRLAPVLQQVLVGDGEVAALQPPPLPVGALGGVQLPGGGVGRRVVPHGPGTDGRTDTGGRVLRT